MESLAGYYDAIKAVHIGCVVASGSLFCYRGVLMWLGSPRTNGALLARLSYAIDTLLLTAAILLMLIIHQYPLVRAWLTVKVLLLFVYVFLGTLALRRGRTRYSRGVALMAAVIVYLFIVSVAVTHDPAGAFRRVAG